MARKRIPKDAALRVMTKALEGRAVAVGAAEDSDDPTDHVRWLQIADALEAAAEMARPMIAH